MNDIRENIKGIFTPVVEMSGDVEFVKLIEQIYEFVQDAKDANTPLFDFVDPDLVEMWKSEIADNEILFAGDLKNPRLEWPAEDIAEVLNLLGLYEFVEAKEKVADKDTAQEGKNNPDTNDIKSASDRIESGWETLINAANQSGQETIAVELESTRDRMQSITKLLHAAWRLSV